MPPLKILAFWDTRPGHRKQTRGIIDALERLTPVHVTDAWVREPSLASALADWGRYALSRLGGAPMPENDTRGNPLPEKADLILGTGSRTHVPMLLYKKQRGGRAVTSMTPDYPFSRHMDLCCIPEHDNPAPGENIFITTGPPNTALGDGKHDPGAGLVLVGGTDPKSHEWDSESILENIRFIAEKSPDISWTVSSSPRTPPDMEGLLESICLEKKNANFFLSRETGPGWVERQYALADICWVTADSVSMIYEALTAGCRVGVLPVKWKDPDGKLARGVNRLLEKNMVLSYEAFLENPGITPGQAHLDEASRCAEEILKRFWAGRLKEQTKE